MRRSTREPRLQSSTPVANVPTYYFVRKRKTVSLVAKALWHNLLKGLHPHSQTSRNFGEAAGIAYRGYLTIPKSKSYSSPEGHALSGYFSLEYTGWPRPWKPA